MHAKFHAVLKRAAQTVGFYDINLLDVATGDVVYTVAKEPDFASDMYHAEVSHASAMLSLAPPGMSAEDATAFQRQPGRQFRAANGHGCGFFTGESFIVTSLALGIAFSR